MTPDLRALTPADRHQVLVALTAVVDHELAAVVTAADTQWQNSGYPLEIRAMLCDLLTWSLAEVRADAYAFVRELLAPTHVH
jgi:hypothetical protein